MNSLHKTTIFLILISSILLSACQPKSPPTSTAVSNETATPRPTFALPPTATKTPRPSPTSTVLPHLQLEVEDLKGLLLTYWHPWPGAEDQKIKDLVYEFNLNNIWGIEVHSTAPGGSAILYDNFNNGLENGNLPNIVEASEEYIHYWYDEGVLVTLQDYVSDPQWGLSEQEIADYQRSWLEQGQKDEFQIALPTQRSLHFMFYNQSWAKELGFAKAPQTLEDFQEQACEAALERKNIDETGGWIINTDPMTSLGWILASNTKEFHDFDEDEYIFYSSQTRETLSLLNQMAVDGCVWRSRLNTPYEYFANRQALFYNGSTPDIPLQLSAMKTAENEDEWLLIPFPSESDVPVIPSSGTAYALRAATPEEQLAGWLFLRWMMLPEHQTLLAKTNNMLPASAESIDSIKAAGLYPQQWEDALLWIPIAQEPPKTSSWRLARNILSDAFWQIYQTNTTSEQIPIILRDLDAIIPEVVKNAK